MIPPMLDHHLKSLELCYFEVSEAFTGLADDHVWKRPAPGILSVGELAGHVAYWEAVRFGGAGEERDLSVCTIKSPLVDDRFTYFNSTVGLAPSADHLAMTASEVAAELQRVHAESMESLKALNPDMAAKAPGWHSTWDSYLRYMTFHIAYHTGQMYTVRHLLGEETPDN